MRAAHRSAIVARDRLKQDQALQPLADQRARLEILARRLDIAGRGALMQGLSVRVRTDQRFAPLFGTLLRLSLQG